MKHSVVLVALFCAFLVSAGSFAQSSIQRLDTRRIFITSHFDCEVYWANRRIATLPRGTRAQLLRSTKKWMLVRYWSGRQYVTGWIKR